MPKYQEIYPTQPRFNSAKIERVSAANLLTLEYFEAEPASMPIQKFDQHHILINLNPHPHRVENWRNGEHRDFTYHKNEIVVTPAGVETGWKWHVRSKVIVITLQPTQFEAFAQKEMGVILTRKQLADIPQFYDEDLTNTAFFIYEALIERDLGYVVLFESLSRMFLVKLIRKYGMAHTDRYEAVKGFTAYQYKRVLEFVKENFAQPLVLEDLAAVAGISPYHFSRLFKQMIGQSPMQYVQAQRLEEAKKLLKDPELPIVEVADHCGFSDQSHFSRFFKRYEGFSPKSFRNLKNSKN